MTAERLAAERAAVLFQHFGWTWGDSEVPPTVDEIERELVRLVEWLYESADTLHIGTGRLRVDREDLDNGLGTRFFLDLAEVNPYDGSVLD